MGVEKKGRLESKGYIILLIMLGLFFITFGYAGITSREIIFILASIFLGFVWVLMLSKYIQDQKFKKSLIENKEEVSSVVIKPENTNVEEPTFTNQIPIFSWSLYDKDNMPLLSSNSLALWKTILNRVRKMGMDITQGLYIIMVLNWTLLIIVSSLYNVANISYFDHLKFTGFSVIMAIFLVKANIRSAFAQGLPLILSIVWLAHPITKGLGGIISKEDGISSQAMIILVIGGVFIIMVWVLLVNRRLQLYQQLAKQTPSAKLLFLWVFRTQSGMEMLTNFGYKWKILGPIFFLNGAGMMSTDDLKLAFNVFSGKKLMINNEVELKQQIKEFTIVPDKYGTYKVQSVLCGDGIWKQTLDYFIETNEVVLMSLCGYTEKNRGCEYEIRKLIDNISMKKIVFFVNSKTDMVELEKDFKEFWGKMPRTSPNSIENPHPIVIYKMTTQFMDELEELERQSGEKSTKEKFKRLKSLSEDGDNIVKLLCQALT